MQNLKPQRFYCEVTAPPTTPTRYALRSQIINILERLRLTLKVISFKPCNVLQTENDAHFFLKIKMKMQKGVSYKI